MEFSEYFPVWNRLSPEQQKTVADSVVRKEVPKGSTVHEGGAECTGLLIVGEGQLRAFVLSKDGREITLYRLLERDICLFSASCVIRSARVEISVEAETDSVLWVIPAEVYRRLAEQSAALANFTNELMASRFSEVMWLMEQILWESMDRRLAAYLTEQAALCGSNTLNITHEQIARDLGTAREVVTRMLRYFKSEGTVSLSRGSIRIENPHALAKTAGNE